ncbi:MAG TPA: hypothetical protein VIJ04_01065 [Xanthobacteraceae bacterium]
MNRFANRFALVLVAGAALAIGLSAADAQTPRRSDGNSTAYGPSGPNRSYMQGPHTRVYITKRSWLDAGVEVLPGDRKFTDYAFPPELGYPSFARENNNRPIDRQPLNTPSDMGGYPRTFPLY